MCTLWGITGLETPAVCQHQAQGNSPFTTEGLLCTLLGTRTPNGGALVPIFLELAAWWGFLPSHPTLLSLPYLASINTYIITIHVYVMPCYHSSFSRIP